MKRRFLRQSTLQFWLIVVLLVSSGGGATVGLTLASRIEGKTAVSVTQALRVATPVSVSSSPNIRIFGGASEDGTKFSSAVEMPVGSAASFLVPIKNLSGREMVVELRLVMENEAQPDVMAEPTFWNQVDSAQQLIVDLRSRFEQVARIQLEPNAFTRLQNANILATRAQDRFNQIKGKGKQKQRSPLMDDFLGMIELQTALSRELNYASNLEPNPEARQHLAVLHTQAALLKQLLDQMVAQLVDASARPQPTLVSPQFDITGAGLINNIAPAGPMLWKFTVPGGATPPADGLVVTVISPVNGKTGFFRFNGEIRTVDF